MSSQSEDRALGQLVALLRLASPSLPIGAYAYSQGLEQAVELGWVSDRVSAEDWILGALRRSLGQFDLPLLARLWGAQEDGDVRAFAELDTWVLAGRESAELQAEERDLGGALRRLLLDTSDDAERIERLAPVSYVAAFAVACGVAGIERAGALAGYGAAWLEHQVSAATRLVPLGQTDGQRILQAGLSELPALVEAALLVTDDEIGTSLPGLAIASALHETQYSRLFRS